MITVILFRGKTKKIKKCVMTFFACDLTFFMYANGFLKFSQVMKKFFFRLHRLQIDPDSSIQYLLLSYVNEQFCAQVAQAPS